MPSSPRVRTVIESSGCDHVTPLMTPRVSPASGMVTCAASYGRSE